MTAVKWRIGDTGGGLRVQFPGRLFSPLFPFSSPLAFFSLQILFILRQKSSECFVHPDQAASPSVSTFVLHCSINFGFCNKNKNTKLKSNFNFLFADSVNRSSLFYFMNLIRNTKTGALDKEKVFSRINIFESLKLSEYFLCLDEKKFRRY